MATNPELPVAPNSTAPNRLSIFGSPPLVEGEDAAAYDELLGRVYAAIKPVDIIDEMFIADVVSLQWEVLRWRRLKSSLIRARGLKALEGFLRNQLNYDLYREHFADDLTDILQDNLAQGEAEDVAQKLAQDCARDEPAAVDKVNKVLERISLHLDNILNRAQARKAEELTQQYVQREPAAVNLINELLAAAGTNIDELMVNALAGREFEYIERIDRLTTIAETRRNASLREIDRRRAVIGETLRRSVQQIEEAEYQVVETTPAKGENPA